MEVTLFIIVTLCMIILLGIPAILSSNKQPVKIKVTYPNFNEVDDLDIKLFDKFTNEAQALGFEKIIEFSVESLVIENYSILYSLSNGIELLCSQMKSNSNKWFDYYELTTKFSDGTELNTRRTQISGVFIKNPKKIIVDVPDNKNIETLLKKHKEYIAMDKKLSGLTIVPLDRNDVENELRKSMKEEMEYQVEMGFCKIDKTGEYYVPTLKLALNGIKNFINPFCDNFTLNRFIIGYGLSAILLWGSILVYMKGYVDQFTSIPPFTLPLLGFALSGLVVGFAFKGKTFTWGLIATLPPALTFYSSLPMPYILFISHFWAATEIEKRSKKMT